jgi:hypothetical protein
VWRNVYFIAIGGDHRLNYYCLDGDATDKDLEGGVSDSSGTGTGSSSSSRSSRSSPRPPQRQDRLRALIAQLCDPDIPLEDIK